MQQSALGQVSGNDVIRGSLRAYRGRISAAGALFCTHQIGEALVPLLVGVIIDRAVATGDPVALAGWLAVLALDFLMLSFSYRFGARQAWHADAWADARLRRLVAGRLLHPRGGGETGRLPGELTGIAVSDSKRVAELNTALPFGLAAIAAVAVAAVALLTIDLSLGLLILLGTPPLLWLVQLVVRPLERRSGPEQERAARAAGTAADLVSGLRVLTGIGARPAAVRRYRASSQDALAATLRATRAEAGFLGAVQLTNGLFLAVIALVGGLAALNGSITVGQLVSAVGLAQFLVGPLQMFGFVSARLAQARASAARIAAVLSAPAVVGEPAAQLPEPAPDAGPGVLSLRGIRFADSAGHHGAGHSGTGHDGSTDGELDTGSGTVRDTGSGAVGDNAGGIDLDVHPGAPAALVAADPEDAAKLLGALAREAEPAAGRITLDGVPLDAWPAEIARGAVLVAAHDAHLFAGSLHENVIAGAPDGIDPQPAMTAAAADQVAATLPAGADTDVSARGRSLSGGQRQRIALARALAADAPVLVLHDPTTAVDAVTETRVAEGLAAHRAGRSTLLVTTSPALLACAGTVTFLVDGRVRARGTHAELMADADYRAVVTA
ncbi:putative ABC transport system ATP-binding protein [Pseudonocardia autotrophica]|uniref:Putative multidrug resistance ABC transporter ATP-binding/permease protein YheI n=1 Tax=Pseudonocardia autotrophica TaxID=2074 RepID=A0A1Y2N302_PSEAH|nr:putative multidrug resistance ABC transporter ATP-binding/permease protein YheI [Pseudonocardia autotrophica]TDN71106.1 putative ABC transport system ATP-binding protein [Pseudonocardia autotrophica]